MIQSTDNFFFRFFTSDYKFIRVITGLQSCAATFYCSFCLSSESQLDLTARTLQHQMQLGTTVEQEIAVARTEAAKDIIYKANYSTKSKPASQFLSFSSICPPPEHTLAGVVNTFLKKALPVYVLNLKNKGSSAISDLIVAVYCQN